MEEVRKRKLAEKLLKKLNNQTDKMDVILESIDRACDFMRNFCNRKDIPKEADYLIYDIALYLLKTDGYIQNEEDVKEISRGDTRIVYGDKKIGNSSIIDNFTDRLIRFRKLGLVRRD